MSRENPSTGTSQDKHDGVIGSDGAAAPAPLLERLKARLRLARQRPWMWRTAFVAITVILAIEVLGLWSSLLGIFEYVAPLAAAHPLAILGVVIVCLFFFFGRAWVRKLIDWVKPSKWKVAGVLAVMAVVYW